MPVIPEPSEPAVGVAPDGRPERPVDTIVVGGGIAGLTAALKLHRSGLSVRVLEASDRAGGAISTLSDRGYLVERGPNTVLDTHAEVADLIELAGLSNERIFASDEGKKRFIVRDGQLLALPTSPGAFLRTPLFSTRAKVRLLAEPFVRRGKEDAEESVAAFTERRLGREFLDFAIDPFVSGVYAGRPERLSVRHAFPKLGEVEQKYGSLILGQIRGARERRRRTDTPKTAARMFSFRSGLAELPNAIARKLGDRVVTGARVTSIVFGDPIWLVRYQTPAGDVRVASASSIVYASGLQNVDLLRPLSGELPAAEKVHYPPLSVVGLGFRRTDVGHPLDGFGMLIPSKERRFVLGTLFSSSLFPGRAPEGHVLLTAFVGGARSAENTLLNEQRLVSAVVKDLRELLHLSGSPLWYDVTRWEKAIPQYEPGYGSVKAELSRIESRFPGFLFAGNYLSGISVAESIKSGFSAASRTIEFCNQTQTILP